jgi:putative transposase
LPESVERIIRELAAKALPDQAEAQPGSVPPRGRAGLQSAKLRAPARNTVALRIAGLDPLKATRRREGQDASRSLQGVGGEPPAVTAPLEQVQIDHTVIDLIVVDETRPATDWRRI